MSAPPLLRIDHIHVFVRDRAAAVRWYADALGLAPLAAYAHWAEDGGPLTLADADDAVHIALFERPDGPPNRATVALATDAPGFAAWRRRLAAVLGRAPAVEDHGEALSLYFSDPDGNPYEITTYEAGTARAALAD